MQKKQKFMKSMEFRENLPSALEDVRFRDAEIIILHYEKPIAKLTGLTEKEVEKLKGAIEND